MFIHSWTSRYCKPWVILRSLITDQMKVRQNLVAKWSLQRIAIFLSLKQTPTEMYQHKMLSSQTTHTYSIVRSYKGGYMVCGNTTQIYILKYNYLQSFFFIFQILLILLSDYETYIEEYHVSNKANWMQDALVENHHFIF